mgnify:CR=1 FL=1
MRKIYATKNTDMADSLFSSLSSLACTIDFFSSFARICLGFSLLHLLVLLPPSLALLLLSFSLLHRVSSILTVFCFALLRYSSTLDRLYGVFLSLSSLTLLSLSLSLSLYLSFSLFLSLSLSFALSLSLSLSLSP